MSRVRDKKMPNIVFLSKKQTCSYIFEKKDVIFSILCCVNVYFMI